MGGTAGSSGTGTGSNANVYTPTGQPSADQLFQQIVGTFPTTPGATPAGTYYPYAQDLFSNFMNSPYANQQLDSAQNAYAFEAGTAFPQATADAKALSGAGGQILNTAFDPQGKLYNAGRGNALDYANVTGSMSGISGTPYGSRVAADSLNNFDIGWQNAQLDRQKLGIAASDLAMTGAQGLNSAATKDLTTYGALPQTTYAKQISDLLGAAGSTVTLGNQQYILPQQALQDLESYLKLGQSASTISGNLGQLGFDQTASTIGGSLSGLNSLFGSNGLLTGTGSGGTSLLSSLFGSGGTTTDLTAATLPAASTDALTSAFGGSSLVDAGAKATPLAFSDRRLKSDIEKLGETADGLGVYSFRYATPQRYIGLMADEVEEVNPDAVGTLPGGWKIVDYSRALQ